MGWKASNRSKAFGEKFMCCYTPIWILVVAVIVIFKWYERFTPNDFIVTGICLSLPCFIAPLVFANREERGIPIFQRYIIKANIFIGILTYLGNHFYTHYFYNVLGARYTGPLGKGRGLEINEVPVSMFLMTHPYFMTYHVLVTPLIRVTKSSFRGHQFQYLAMGVLIVVVAYLTAFLETFTISSFPYYTYPDLQQMLTKGSVFYGTFFVVTFPWFYRLDEKPMSTWSISKVVTEALAAMMVVLICADFWRLGLKYFGYIPSRHTPYG